MESQKKPTSIRLNKEIEELVREEAKKSKRSVSKQIEFIIEEYYKIKNRLQEN